MGSLGSSFHSQPQNSLWTVTLNPYLQHLLINLYHLTHVSRVDVRRAFNSSSLFVVSLPACLPLRHSLSIHPSIQAESEQLTRHSQCVTHLIRDPMGGRVSGPRDANELVFRLVKRFLGIQKKKRTRNGMFTNNPRKQIPLNLLRFLWVYHGEPVDWQFSSSSS